jgi:hypothetical protein
MLSMSVSWVIENQYAQSLTTGASKRYTRKQLAIDPRERSAATSQDKYSLLTQIVRSIQKCRGRMPWGQEVHDARRDFFLNLFMGKAQRHRRI